MHFDITILPAAADQKGRVLVYIASTRPGTDFPARFERLLSQTEGQWRGVMEDLDEKSDGGDWGVLPRRVTVREVLKYSLTWVIIPSATVQAWIQEMEPALSQPSTRTVDPKEAMESGTNSKESTLELEVPVSRRIINWWEGGPWNHHSRSEAKSLCTVSTSRVLSASYRASTTLSLLLDSSRLSCKLASSGRKKKKL